MLIIPKSSFFEATDIRLAYDFVVWDVIIMTSILVIPYLFFLIAGKSKSMRPASILIVYTLYFTLFLRIPFSNHTIIALDRFLLVL